MAIYAVRTLGDLLAKLHESENPRPLTIEQEAIKLDWVNRRLINNFKRLGICHGTPLPASEVEVPPELRKWAPTPESAPGADLLEAIANARWQGPLTYSRLL